MPVQVASPAPDFQGKAYFAENDEFRDVTLADYRGRWLCLYFFPMAFSYVCATEPPAFADAKPRFDELGCDLLGCSVDTHLVLKAWTHHENKLANLSHPLLSDVTKRITMDYGLLLPEKGIALRGTFLIDPNGVLRHHSVNDLFIGRSVDGILRILRALQTEKMCPCNWKQGEATLTT